MSWSLKLRDGDFDVQNAQLGIARGHAKLVQDFQCALLESLGNDPLHPTWGSTLDGGIDTNGTYIQGIIGEHDMAFIQTRIDSEIRRIAALLQQRQLSRVQRERLSYNKVTLTASEILVAVSNIRVIQAADVLTVLITLQTGANTTLDITVPIADGSIVAL